MYNVQRPKAKTEPTLNAKKPKLHFSPASSCSWFGENRLCGDYTLEAMFSVGPGQSVAWGARRGAAAPRREPARQRSVLWATLAMFASKPFAGEAGRGEQ